jgi:glycosyltransferase involved in cell wall biosynthesis
LTIRENRKALPDFAFVIKCYDSDLVGGGETLVRQFSRRLADLGYAVKILTTSIRDYRDWREVYPPGLSLVEEIPVRRFPISQIGDDLVYKQLSYRIGNRLARSESEEYHWFRVGLHSPAMYRYLQQHGRNYRLIIALDYFVGLSLYALAANSGRTAVYPQLHNEPFAYLPSVRRWLNAAHGVMFNVPPERDFARFELGVSNPQTAIVGVGVETGLIGRPDRFRQKYHIDQPFLLYVGRLDVAKNLPMLIAYFQRYKALQATDLKLVLMGKGPHRVAAHPDVLSLGFCPEEDKFDAYAAALALCQPSLLESLSIVALEALAQGTPILVQGTNDVTRYHCLTGNCGLYFYTYDDFALALNYLQTHLDARQQLGRNGQHYVLGNYTWDKVTERLLAALDRFGL